MSDQRREESAVGSLLWLIERVKILRKQQLGEMACEGEEIGSNIPYTSTLSFGVVC